MRLSKSWPFAHPVARRVESGFSRSGELDIHYVTLGEGPLVVLIHGIPEFWYSWRHQITPLADYFKVAAMDQRGFNKSDWPSSRDGYHVRYLVEDVSELIRHFGQEQAVIVGHDAGAWTAWHFAAVHPEMTRRLVILCVPHPNAFREELSQNAAQYQASGYARKMQEPNARPLFRVGPVGLLRDPKAAALYIEAERGTDPGAITAFYQLNYPRAPYEPDEAMNSPIEAPTLVIHGVKDPYLLASGHTRNAHWLSHNPTTVMLDAGHFVHQEKPAEVNKTLLDWLNS